MKVVFVGGGNMGSTYARAFSRSNMIKKEDILIIEKDEGKRKLLNKEKIATLASEIVPEIKDADIIFLAVKPQDFKSIVPDLKKVIRKKHLLISIMAGIKIKTIIDAFSHTNVVRAMPNTPAQLGFGITAFAATKDVPAHIISQVDTLLETTGKSIFMKDEALMDAVTAISGSGPAYFFYFVKHMTEAGINMGLEPHVATMLVRQTMLGSFEMLSHSSQSPDDLIKSVASKGGTTEAALNHFEKSAIGKNIEEALKAAEQRAKQLSAEVMK